MEEECWRRGEGVQVPHPRVANLVRRSPEESSRNVVGRQALCRDQMDSGSPSGSKGSATTRPSAFLRRISTLPSASSSCFWHSAERATPSSKSFMASSRESCGLSSLRTTSSRRERQRSKSGFLGGSDFLGTGVFTCFSQGTVYGRAERGNKLEAISARSRSFAEQGEMKPAVTKHGGHLNVAATKTATV